MTPIILDPDGDPRDLSTLDAVRRLLQTPAGQTQQDPLLRDLITQASVMLPQALGRQFIAEDNVTKTLTYGGSGWVNLAPYDLRAITAVTKDVDGTTPLELTAGTWQLRGQTGSATYRDVYLTDYGSERLNGNGQQAVSITGDWGFEEVPADVQHGVNMTVKTWLREGAAFSNEGDVLRFERIGRIPQDVLDGLSHYRLPIVY